LPQADWLAHLGTGGPKYTEYAMGSHSLLETLYKVPSCKPDVGHLFEALPHLQPRMYSLSSSPEYHPGQAHITVAEVRD
jgi:NADPH-ferrihemoprotein reductase